jgi:glycosyltransferase involved in cell wall biosynthesis
MKVSIITPSYNQGQFIEQTILSVLNQTYKNIEYIIVDGGSNDNTMEVVNKYKSEIDIIIHEKDHGQADAINKGFRLATGRLVGWVNSDDLLYPLCVEEIVSLATVHPDGCIYYPAVLDMIDNKGNLLRQIKKRIYNKDTLVNTDYEIIQQGSFYNLAMVANAEFLDEKINYCMDLDLWLRLLDYGNIYFYEGGSISAFRLWNDSKTSTGGVRFLNDIKRTLKKHGMKTLSSNNYFLNYYILKSRIKSLIISKK